MNRTEVIIMGILTALAPGIPFTIAMAVFNLKLAVFGLAYCLLMSTILLIVLLVLSWSEVLHNV